MVSWAQKILYSLLIIIIIIIITWYIILQGNSRSSTFLETYNRKLPQKTPVSFDVSLMLIAVLLFCV